MGNSHKLGQLIREKEERQLTEFERDLVDVIEHLEDRIELLEHRVENVSINNEN